MPVLQEKTFTITQAVAEGFKEEKVEIPRLANEVIWLYEIEIDFDPNVVFDGLVDDDDLQFQVSLEPETAILNLNSKNLICAIERTVIAHGTVADALIVEHPIVKTFNPPKPIYQSDVYCAIDSTGQAAAITLYGRIKFSRNVPKDETLKKILERI